VRFLENRLAGSGMIDLDLLADERDPRPDSLTHLGSRSDADYPP
jgi:hypothetical protein